MSKKYPQDTSVDIPSQQKGIAGQSVSKKLDRSKVIALAMPVAMNNNEPFELSDDEIVEFKKKIGEIYHALMFVYDGAKDKRLKVSDKFNGVSVAIANVKDVAKLLKQDNDLEAERDRSSQVMRMLNEEIARLNARIGGEADNETIVERLNVLYGIVYKWFSSYGGYARNVNFIGGNCNVEVSIVGPGSVRKLKNSGLQVSCDEEYILDTPENRRLFIELVNNRFPETYVNDIHIMSTNVGYVIRDMKLTLKIVNINEDPKDKEIEDEY